MKADILPDEWYGLDRIAEANLTGIALAEFFRYRDALHAEGHEWLNDAEDILYGYIWDASEERCE